MEGWEYPKPNNRHFKVFARRRDSWMTSSFEKGKEERNEHIISLFHVVVIFRSNLETLLFFFLIPQPLQACSGV